MSKDYRFKKETLEDAEYIFSDSEEWICSMEKQSQKIAQSDIEQASKHSLKRKRESKQLSRGRIHKDDMH